MIICNREGKKVADFQDHQQGIKCMMAIARILGQTLQADCPGGIVLADLPKGLSMEHGVRRNLLIARV